MKFTIDKSSLIATLDTAHKAVSTKPTLPILEGFLLDAEGDTLRVTGNDLEIGIQAEAKADVQRPGKIVVNARLFSDVIKRMPDEEIDITLNGTELTIQAGKADAKIKTLPATGYPSLPSARGGQVIEIEQQVLKELITKTVFAVSESNNDRPFLEGGLLECKDGQISITACDGFRIAHANSKGPNVDFNYLVRGRILSEVSKIFKSGKIRFYSNNNLVMFEGESFYATIRIIDKEYLNYRAIMQMSFVTQIIIDVNEMKYALDAQKPFEIAGEKVPTKIKIKDKVSTQYLSSAGETRNYVNADISGKEGEFQFNSKYFSEVLRDIDDKQIKMQFGELGHCLITPKDSSKFMHFILPVRK